MVFKLPVISFIMEDTEQSESSYYSLSYWDRHPSSSPCSFKVITDLLNSEILKKAIAQLCDKLQVCNFTMLYLIQKWVNNIFKQNILNAIVLKF